SGLNFLGILRFSLLRLGTKPRALQAARNLDHGRWGALFARAMQLPFLVLLIFPGILARDVFPDLEYPDLAWPSLIFEYMPVGVRGLIVAALLAALMSSLDSVLNGAFSPCRQ
ncbi:hypothetical protein ACFP47_10505, partial [Nesterenkonia lacusekhoensis]